MRFFLTTFLICLTTGAAHAEGGVDIELNAAAPQSGACMLSFLVQNSHETAIEQAVYEAVFFDVAGQVERLTLFDFGALPVGRPRVRQFAVPDLECTALGKILLNGANICRASDEDSPICTMGLTAHSRVSIKLRG